MYVYKIGKSQGCVAIGRRGREKQLNTQKYYLADTVLNPNLFIFIRSFISILPRISKHPGIKHGKCDATAENKQTERRLKNKTKFIIPLMN